MQTLALGSTWCRASQAQPLTAPAQAPATEGPQQVSVEIVVIGDAATLRTVSEAVGRQGPGAARLDWTRAPRLEPTDVLQAQRQSVHGRCFIDLSLRALARLYFADQTAERFLMREIALPRGLDELAQEELAQILRASLEALLEASTGALTRAELTSVLAERTRDAPSNQPRSPTAIPARTRRPRPRDGALAKQRFGYGPVWAAFYAVQGYASEVPLAHGPGARLAERVRWQSNGLSCWISAQYWLPQRLVAPVVGVGLDTLALRAGLGFERAVLSRLALAARLGAGVDLVHIAPRSGAATEAALTDERWSSVAVVTLAVAGRYRMSRSLALEVSLLSDADLRPRHYYFQTNSRQVRVLEPWLVRPGLSLAISSP